MTVAERSTGEITLGRRQDRYLLDSDRLLGPALMAPAVVYLLLVVAYPLGLAFVYAFSDVTTGSRSLHFVGLQTFIAAVQDPVFLTTLRNTFVFTALTQLCVVLLSTVLAFVLTANFRGRWFVRFLVLMPWTTPVALSAVIWLWMLDSIFSPFDWFAQLLGIVPPGGHIVFLGQSGLAMGSIIALQVWRVLPLATVILMAGLTAIPAEVSDAAEVDGAGFWRRLFGITLPLLSPVMTVALLFGIVFTFTDMAAVFVLTGGGPGNATQVLASWAFYKGINGGNLSVGAADAIIMFPVLLGLAAVLLRIASRAEVSEMAAAQPRTVRGRIAIYTLAIAFAVLAGFPFLWAALTMFRQNADLYDPTHNPFVLTRPATFSHITDLLRNTPYLHFIVNNIVIGLAVVVITLALSLPAAYALARLMGRWGERIGIAIFVTYLVPPTLLFLPLSRLITTIGLQDSIWSLILVYPGFTIPLSTWLLMGFLRSVPRDIEEQAQVDGYSRIEAVVRTVLPLALPGIFTVVVFTFTLTMQDFIYALAFVSSSSSMTVSVGVPTVLIRGDVFYWQSLMASAIIVAVPVALLYNVFLGRFIQGFTLGAVKG